MNDQPEVWLRGPVAGVPALLQPVAHALIQAREDVARLVPTLSSEIMWTRAGAASPGFHVLHLAGALDRLFTYARGEALTDEQKTAARAEALDHPELDGSALIAHVSQAVDRALAQIGAADLATLFEERRVGRTAAASAFGILFHAAEHTTRHAGQFITTAKMLTVR